MVYLDLSVESIDQAVEFYSKKLGIFSYQPDSRLICNLGVDLILDLHECGSESHIECFGQSQHVPASFWIHVGGDDQFSEIEIYEHLRSNGVQFEMLEIWEDTFLNLLILPIINSLCMLI